MKEIIIRNNSNQIITITDEVKELGAKFVLINEKNAPIAWYEFDKEKFNNIKLITKVSHTHRSSCSGD